MYYAIYTFFTAGVAFLSRIIELWILIIFSPFAFMSSALPILKKVSSIGWDEWVKKLVAIPLYVSSFGDPMDHVRYLLGIRETPVKAFLRGTVLCFVASLIIAGIAALIAAF